MSLLKHEIIMFFDFKCFSEVQSVCFIYFFLVSIKIYTDNSLIQRINIYSPHPTTYTSYVYIKLDLHLLSHNLLNEHSSLNIIIYLSFSTDTNSPIR